MCTFGPGFSSSPVAYGDFVPYGTSATKFSLVRLAESHVRGLCPGANSFYPSFRKTVRLREFQLVSRVTSPTYYPSFGLAPRGAIASSCAKLVTSVSTGNSMWKHGGTSVPRDGQSMRGNRSSLVQLHVTAGMAAIMQFESFTSVPHGRFAFTGPKGSYGAGYSCSRNGEKH